MAKPLTPEEIETIVEMWDDNPADAIAKKIGKETSTVNNTAKKIRDASAGELCKKKGGGSTVKNAIASLVASKTKLSKEEALKNIEKNAPKKK